MQHRRIARRVALAIAAFVSAAPKAPALGAWSANVTYDAAGRLRVSIRGDLDGNRAIYAMCDISRSTILAVLVPATDPVLTATGMTLSFAFADGARWTSPASLYRYDDTQVAVGYGSANDVPAIVEALASARDVVTVGLSAASTGQARSWTADVRGSTTAARKFLDNCFPTN
jgi:hypothetical protein